MTDGERRTERLKISMAEYARGGGRWVPHMLASLDAMCTDWPCVVVTVPDRLVCPSCGMRGASFEPCIHCHGPACDNCRNAAHREPVCMVCQGESSHE